MLRADPLLAKDLLGPREEKPRTREVRGRNFEAAPVLSALGV